MGSYQRIIDVSRSQVDTDSGHFSAVLFSEGEAADGHILRAKGCRFPQEGIPLFVNHNADPRTQLGRIHHERIEGGRVHVTGEILTEGEGAEAEIRRDILLKMSRGMLKSLSGRWDSEPGSAKPRRSLPKDHPAYCDDGRGGSGLYFHEWTAMEGSVVGLGADPQATVRWARDKEATPAVRAFWQEFVGDEEEAPQVPDLRELIVQATRDAVTEVMATLVRRIEVLEEDALEATEEASRDTGEGLPKGSEDPTPKEEPDVPAQQWSPTELFELLRSTMERERTQYRGELQAAIRAAQGKVK